MELIDKIEKLLIGDETTADNIATNTGKGKIDVIGMRKRKRKGKNKSEGEDCPEGQKWCDKEGKCIPE